MTARDALRTLSRRLHSVEPTARVMAGRSTIRGFGPVLMMASEPQEPAGRPLPPKEYAEGDEPFGYGEEEPPLFSPAALCFLGSMAALGATLIWIGVTGFGG